MTNIAKIISEVERELDYLNENYSGVPLQPLYDLIGSLSELLDDTLRGVDITTPFSDDLGTEDNYCYPRELGEVHDTFNVVIQGSGNPITLTRQVIRSSQDDGSYLQSMVDVLSKLRSDN
jgi:hypothetical protein